MNLVNSLLKPKLICKLDRDVLARYLMSKQNWVLAHEKAKDSLMFDDDPKVVGGWTKMLTSISISVNHVLVLWGSLLQAVASWLYHKIKTRKRMTLWLRC